MCGTTSAMVLEGLCGAGLNLGFLYWPRLLESSPVPTFVLVPHLLVLGTFGECWESNPAQVCANQMTCPPPPYYLYSPWTQHAYIS